MKTEIKNTVKNVYFAGLGVVSFAQKEAVKAYDTLIKEGQSWEKKSKKTVDQISNTAEKKFSNIRKVAGEQLSKVEKVLDSGVEKTLKKFDIPTIKDIKGLSKKVDSLAKELKNAESKKVA